MTAKLPEGVWSLQDALKKKEEIREANERKQLGRRKRRNVITIDDETSDSDISVAKKPGPNNNVTKETDSKVRKPPDQPSRKRLQNGTTKQAAPATEQDTKTPGPKRPLKTRGRPKRSTHDSSESDTETFYTPPTKALPREGKPARKSPRILEKAIVLDSDSDPELLPITMQPEVRSKPTKRPPLRLKSNNTQNEEFFTPPMTQKRSKRTKPETKIKLIPAKSPKVDSPKVDSIPSKNIVTKCSSPVTKPDRPALKRAAKKPLPKKHDTSESDEEEDAGKPLLIRIPDKIPPGKKKLNVTSKVLKIKKPAAKKGPVKAGAKAPLAVGTEIENKTQKTKYILDSVLGSGGFGYIYICTDCSNKRKAVMKVEPQDNGPLFSEMHFYQRAGKEELISGWCKKEKLKYLGIPHMIGFGIHAKDNVNFRYLVMPKFDGDVLKLHESLNNKFSMESTLLLCIRMLEALQYMHDVGYVHADIKSANILIKNKKEVYLADFGLARKYTFNDQHKVYKEEPAKAHDGTKEYTSIDAHKGVAPSRRGDLQILGYCCIQWLGGTLPWFSWDNGNKIRDEKIKHQNKMSSLLESSIGLANLTSRPWSVLKGYLDSCFKLKYDETPKYKDFITKLKSGLKGPDTGYLTWS